MQQPSSQLLGDFRGCGFLPCPVGFPCSLVCRKQGRIPLACCGISGGCWFSPGPLYSSNFEFLAFNCGCKGTCCELGNSGVAAFSLPCWIPSLSPFGHRGKQQKKARAAVPLLPGMIINRPCKDLVGQPEERAWILSCVVGARSGSENSRSHATANIWDSRPAGFGVPQADFCNCPSQSSFC